MRLRLIVQTLVSYGVIGLVLFLASGTTDWWAAWILLAELTALSLAAGLWLLRHHPAIVRERMAAPVQKDQPGADKVLVIVLLLVVLGFFVLVGLDAVRFGWSAVPLPVRMIGALILFLSLWIGLRVLRENSFASPAVKIQTDHGHQVVSTGPYSYVRHPMYTGALLTFLGISLQLGSWWGLAGVAVLAVLFAFRTRIEEQALRAGLDGYDAYAARVRYRLIPSVW